MAERLAYSLEKAYGSSFDQLLFYLCYNKLTFMIFTEF